MAEFSRFGAPKVQLVVKSSTGVDYVDFKNADELRRMLTPNGKIQTRKRTGLSSYEQRMVARAIKQARYMSLLPYTDATL